MTSLHERVGTSDPIDRVADEACAGFVLGDNDSDLRVDLIDTAAVTEPPVAPTNHRSGAWVRSVFGNAFARSPKRPKRERKHYPVRFSIEFETSLVDRERRRL
jgi:hypothetical protein